MKECKTCGRIHSGKSPTRISIGLLVNVLLVPGMGTCLYGDIRKGMKQFGLFVVGIPMILFFFLGLGMIIGAWIWAFSSSVQELRKT